MPIHQQTTAGKRNTLSLAVMALHQTLQRLGKQRAVIIFRYSYVLAEINAGVHFKGLHPLQCQRLGSLTKRLRQLRVQH